MVNSNSMPLPFMHYHAEFGEEEEEEEEEVYYATQVPVSYKITQ